MNLFKPAWKVAGQRREGRIWWMEATVAGKRVRRSLGVRDKHAAQALAGDILRKLELRAAGIPVQEDAQDASAEALIEDYEAELVRRRSSPVHVARTITRAREVVGKARSLSEITPEVIRRALVRVGSRGVAPQTVNAYRVAAHSFFAWLVRDGRWQANPVAGVARVRPGEPTRTRRSLTHEELQRLIAAAPAYRAACYLLAATTGLRRAEMAALRWADVDLENATLRVRATVAKSRREAVLPLPAGTVAMLKGLRGKKPPTASVLRAVPITRTFRLDLAKAKIPFSTHDGVVDVHGLRVTYGTLLARAGVSLAQAQKLMRHSTPVLTANIYTKLQMDDARAAVAKIDVGAKAVAS